MKSSALFIAAAMAGIGAPAGAQSNVKVFGSIDANVGQYKGSNTGVNASDRAVKKVDAGGLTTSYLGFRGDEDLGGGLFAGFELTGFVRNDTGASGRADAIGPPVNVSGDPFWARASWVGLSSKSWGRLRFGNATSLLFVNAVTSNAFVDSTVFSPVVLVTFIGSPLSGGTSWTNQIVYDSPVIGGFNASAAVSASEGQGGRNAAVRVAYAAGSLAAGLAWQSVKKNPATFADGTSANNTATWQLSGSYDFNVVKVFGNVGRLHNTGTETAPLDITHRIWSLSASVPVGLGYALAGYAVRTTGDAVGPVPATAAGGTKERKVATIGYDYFLSKRTDLYAVVMNDRTVTNVLPVGRGLVSASGTSTAVGIRHRF